MFGHIVILHELKGTLFSEMSKSLYKSGGASCCVPGYTANYDKNSKRLSFHRLPTDDQRCKEWMSKIPRDWKAEGFNDPLRDVNRHNTFVCSRHFLISKLRLHFVVIFIHFSIPRNILK